MRARLAGGTLRRGSGVLLLLAATVSVSPAAAVEKQISSRKFHEAIAHCRGGDEALGRGELSRASEQFEKALGSLKTTADSLAVEVDGLIREMAA
ncbi:MAG: hypothetical protein MUE47_10040, partial [Acidobacteria bacterium]|nr:hypothetical protein [Acidobacteriota bacterium]